MMGIISHGNIQKLRFWGSFYLDTALAKSFNENMFLSHRV